MISTLQMFLLFPSVSTRDIQDQKGSVCVFPLSTAQDFSLLQSPEIIPFLLAFSSIFLLGFSVLWYPRSFPLCRSIPVVYIVRSSCPSLKILPLIPHPCPASSWFSAPSHHYQRRFCVLPSHLFFY